MSYRNLKHLSAFCWKFEKMFFFLLKSICKLVVAVGTVAMITEWTLVFNYLRGSPLHPPFMTQLHNWTTKTILDSLFRVCLFAFMLFVSSRFILRSLVERPHVLKNSFYFPQVFMSTDIKTAQKIFFLLQYLWAFQFNWEKAVSRLLLLIKTFLLFLVSYFI